MRMDLLGERFRVEEGYEVRLPPGNHLVLIAGAYLGDAGYDFDHPSVVAKRSELFEFKHSCRNGRKFWTSKVGINFYFVVPKAQMDLLSEKGYSDVPVLIGGRKYRMNVSGGTNDCGWVDVVPRVAHIGCGFSTAALRSLARIALPPNECQAQGITLEIEAIQDCQQASFIEAAAAVTMRTRLAAGSRVFLREGWSYMGRQGPLAVESRPPRKRYFICTDGSARVRVQYAAIDWTKTAEVNGVAVPAPVLVNRIAPVLAPIPV